VKTGFQTRDAGGSMLNCTIAFSYPVYPRVPVEIRFRILNLFSDLQVLVRAPW